MRAKAFFEKKNKQANLNNEDFNKFLETVPAELEIPDVWVNLFEDSFMTLERAQADDRITKKIISEVLNAVDKNLEKIYPLLDAKVQEEISKEKNSYRKIELIKDAIPQMLEKVREGNPNSEERVKQLEKNVKEFADKLAASSQEFANREKELTQRHEEEKAGLRLGWTLDKKFADFVFADEFKDLKPAIIKNIIDTVRAKETLQLDEKGEIVVVEIDPTTKVAKPKFIGNDPVTIDLLLSEPVKPFLKRNNAGSEGPTTTGSGGTPTQRRQTQGDVDPSKMTLQQRRVYEAQQNATA